MTRADEIVDQDSLKEWLKTRPVADARLIAFRAAARVMPIWWHACLTEEWARKRDLTALPVLRSLLISSVAAVSPTADMKAAADAAADAAAALAAAADAALAAATAASACAVDAAAAIDATAAVNFATLALADAVAARTALWAVVRNDAEMLEIGAVVGSVALWPGDNPLAEVWVKTKAQLENQDQSDDWAFWIWWYDGLLSGTAPDPASPWMQEIALLPDALWQDEGAALARINEIWRGAIADTASATLVAVDATIGAIRSERGIGHNMPPEPIDEVESTDPLEILYQLRVPLADVTIELAKPTPDTSQLASLGQKILRLGVRFARYCGELADTFLKELAKKLAAPAAIALVGWAVVSTTPSVPFEALGNALKNLGGAQVQHPVSQGSDIKNRPQRAKR